MAEAKVEELSEASAAEKTESLKDNLTNKLKTFGQ
jgi:hypothetical protein